MKKSSPPNKKPARRKSRKISGGSFRSTANRPGPPSSEALRRAGPEEDALNISLGAREVHSRSRQLYRKADDLHKSIERMHRKAASRHRKTGESKPVLIPDGQLLEEADEALAEKAAMGKPFPIVGIGASAGGFEAFSEFLKSLPIDTGMAFVLVQHLDPKHKSQLTELLGCSASLPVVEAKDDVEVVPDYIYVIPANAQITIMGGRLRVSPRKENELPPMPVDAFFRSLAAEQQDRAIGIVLSGTGTDGTLGIEAIKGEGGITFAQQESSAKYFGMPGSAIRSGSVDFILTPEG